MDSGVVPHGCIESGPTVLCTRRFAGWGHSPLRSARTPKPEQRDYELQRERQPRDSAGERQRALLRVHLKGRGQQGQRSPSPG